MSGLLATLVLASAPIIASAQTASILPNARTQFIDANGNPVVGGTVTFYVPSTTTPKTTWQDSGETTPNSNPVTLDGLGTAKIWGEGSYRQIVKDSLGNVIWDAVTASGGTGGGGSGVASLNGQTGAVNIVAGSGISVSASGGNITLTSSGGGSGTVTQVAAISNLRALTSVSAPVVVVRNYATSGDYGGGVFTYNSTDTTSTDNNCTIFVDASSHRWYRQTGKQPVDVRWCGAVGDGSTNDNTAMQAAVAVGPSVYVPAGTYKITGSLALRAGETIFGDSPYTSIISGVRNGTGYPLITTTPVSTTASTSGACDATSNYVYSLCNISVSKLGLNSSGSTPVTGDAGISFMSYTNNTTISDMFIQNQWDGMDLGPADANFIRNSVITGNYNDGIEISNTTYAALQWNFDTVFSINNERNGIYSFVNVGAGYVGLYVSGGPPQPLTQVTLGTWRNLNTFANANHGVSATGNASGPVPLQGIRIIDGFFGQDGNDEIYLDTYNTGGGALTIQPNYIELAGTGATGRVFGHAASGIGSGIFTTASVGPIIVKGSAIKQNSYDGITSNGSSLVVDGGIISDNGVFAAASTMQNGLSYTIQSVGTTNFTSFGALANTVGTVFTKSGGIATGTGLVSSTGRSNGIYINSGGASGVAINGVQSGNTSGGGTQLYGIASNVDYIAISGSNLLNNTTGPVTGTALANSVTSGSLPVAINTGGGGGGSYCSLSGCTMTGPLIVNSTLTTSGLATLNSLSVTNASSMNGGLTMVGATGITGANSGITMKDIQATRSMGVGTAGVADGVDGHFIAGTSMIIGAPTGGYQAGSLNVPTAVLVNNVGIAVGSYCALTGCTMTGPLVVNSTAQIQSLGVGAAADGTTAHITGPGGGLAFAGGTNVNFTGSTVTTGTVQSNAGFYGNGTAIISGVTNVTASGQVQGQDLFATRSLGVQTTPSAVAGRIDAGGLSYFPQGINAGTVGTFPNAFHGGITVADGGMTFTTGVAGNGLTVDNINVIKSVGIGTTPSGSIGQLAVSAAAIIGTPTGSYQSFALNVQGSLLVNNVAVGGGSYCALSGCTMTGPINMSSNNITSVGTLSTTAIIASGQVQAQDLYATRSVGIATAPDGVSGHIAGSPLAFTGSSINMTGALAVTGNVQMQSLYATTSAGIGTSPSGTSGRLDVGGVMVGVPTIGGYAAGSVNAQGTLYGDTGVVAYGALAWGNCAYAISASFACMGGGSVNAASGVYLNGTLYTNP